MDLREGLRATQRWVVLVTLVLVPLVRWSASDTFSLAKFVVMLTGATVLGLSAATLGADRLRAGGAVKDVRALRSQPWTLVVVGLLLVLSVATVRAEDTVAAVLGPYRRWNGLLGYVSAVSAGLVVAVRFVRTDVRLVARIVAGTASIAALHGLLQWLELIDTDFVATGRAVFANLGNANFLAAYLAIALPFLLVEIVDARESRQRIALGAATTLVLVTLLLTEALQGPAAAAVGLAVGAVVWLWSRRRTVAVWIAGVLAAGVGLAALGLASIGPLARLAELRTFQLRLYYWDAALDIASSNVVTGVGPGRYIGYFRASRSLEAAQELPVTLEVDGPHNIALDLLVSGGAVAMLLLLAAWALAAWALVRVVRRGDGKPLVAALAAAWAAYVTQAMVSLDTPALLLLGWVLTGALVAVDRQGAQEAASAKASAAAKGNVKGKRNRKGKRKRPAPTSPVVASGAALTGLVGLLVFVVGVQWIQADRGLSTSAALRQNNDLPGSLTGANRSLDGPVDLAVYHLNRAEILTVDGDLRRALQDYDAALQFDARFLRAVVGRARALDRLERTDEAFEAWQTVLDVEPQSAPLWGEASLAALHADAVEEAERLARVGIGLDDKDGASWGALGLALLEQGDLEEARAALETAARLGITDSEVAAALGELRG